MNDSSQPHFAEFTHFSPEYTVTEELFDQWILADMGMATPDPAAPMPPDEALTITGFAGLQSAGTTQWVVMDFTPGTYSVTCWVPDPRHQGTPHSAMGMYATFLVA